LWSIPLLVNASESFTILSSSVACKDQGISFWFQCLDLWIRIEPNQDRISQVDSEPWRCDESDQRNMMNIMPLRNVNLIYIPIKWKKNVNQVNTTWISDQSLCVT
jgi:hypothetical protein